MSYIFFIASFNAFFFSLLLIQKKNKNSSDYILIAWLLYLGVFIGVYSFFSHDLFIGFKLLSVSFISLFYLQGLFLYLYVLKLVVIKRKLRKQFYHFIPIILFNSYLIITSFFPQISENIKLENIHLNIQPPLLFLLFFIITLLSGPFYFWLTLKLLKKHNINIFNNFSSIEKVNLKWLKKLVIVFGIIWTSLIIITSIHHILNFFPMFFCTDSLFIALSLFVILIGYIGLKQHIIFENEIKKNTLLINEKKKYLGSSLKEFEAEKYKRIIETYMQSEKPYLNSEITLTNLASQINISSHHLSQIINEQFNKNFFEFINEYRVNEVKSKIQSFEYNHCSLLGIALDSGFNSKSAFNRIFKKYTNQTPSQFKSAIKVENNTSLTL